MRLFRRAMPEPEVEPEEPRSYPVAHRVYYKKFDDPTNAEYMREFTPQEHGEQEWDFVKSVRSCRNGMYGERRTTVWSSGNES